MSIESILADEIAESNKILQEGYEKQEEIIAKFRAAKDTMPREDMISMVEGVYKLARLNLEMAMDLNVIVNDFKQKLFELIAQQERHFELVCQFGSKELCEAWQQWQASDWQQQHAKYRAKLIDDWGLAPPSAAERSDLLEVLDDRVNRRIAIIWTLASSAPTCASSPATSPCSDCSSSASWSRSASARK